MKTESTNLIFNNMERGKSKLIISIILVVAASCNEPETVVTNIVHPDGSVTRRIEMRNTENKFDISAIQVPFDSTWIIKDSLEVGGSVDSVWVRRAEKLFASVEEINKAYKSDSGANKDISRHAEFRKKFKWFNNEYTFSEIIDKKMKYGYPVREYLNQKELKWFYTPDNINNEKKNGPDSLKFRAFNDSVNKKLEKWYMKNLVSEWIGEFGLLTDEKVTDGMTRDSLKLRENEFVKIVEKNVDHFDSLWQNGTLLREFIGEANALKYKKEADSAANIATERFWVSFKPYTIRTIMPGKLTGTNGLIDSAGFLLWPVNSDFFLTEPYLMQAESKTPNRWAWIVSGLFLLFVITGIILKRKGKG
jgi:hypothetical protein